MKGKILEDNTIDSYLNEQSEETQKILRRVRRTIKKSAPLAKEAIKYGIPTFVLNKKNLVHFAACKNHLGFYPSPSGISHFKKELTPYKTSKRAVNFPYDEPIPYELIERIVLYRVSEC